MGLKDQILLNITVQVNDYMLINLQSETEDCYKEEKTRPLVNKQNGGTVYTVAYNTLESAKSNGRNVTVVITSGTLTSGQ